MIRRIFFDTLPLMLLAAIGCAGASSGSARSPFLDRFGATFSLMIDGRAVEPINPLAIEDAKGAGLATVRWAGTTAGRPCFLIEPIHGGLGEFRQATLQLTEINLDRPLSRWRQFLALPHAQAPDGTAVWVPGRPYCPEEYILTERLRFKELPPGEYVATIRYQGSGNWDRKDVLLDVPR